MTEKITSKMIGPLRDVETALIQKDYGKLDKKARGGRLSAEEIRNAINGYGGTITRMPDENLHQISIIKVLGTNPTEWAVDLDLWIDNRPSDLTVSIIIQASNGGNFMASIDDIHVL